MTSSEEEHLLESQPVEYGAATKCDDSVSDLLERPSPKQSQVWLSYLFCVISGFCFIAW